MSDDLKSARTALAKLHRDIGAINLLSEPPHLDLVKQFERVLAPINRQLPNFGPIFEMSRAMSPIQEIANANQHWQKLIKRPLAINRIAENFAATHRSWFDSIKPIQHNFSNLSQLQVSAKLALCDTSLRLAATGRLMADINFDAIRSRFQIEMPVISELESSITRVVASYGSLAESFREISDITRLPSFVLSGATREIYTTSFALETFRPWDERDEDKVDIQFRAEAEMETSGCITLLQQIDPLLARPYVGARDALNGNNVDRARHILSSLRELWNHLLRRLAPDDLVSAWIPGMPNNKDLLHEGKPTRRARVLFICRELNNDPLTDFLVHDTRALVELIELFNRVHELETPLTDEQLRAIFLKTDSWLMYILQISVDKFHN